MGTKLIKDKYKIIKQLGAGGFGVVYLVKNKENQYFALKKLIENAQTKSTIKLLSELMNKLMKIESKYIIKYYEYFEQ